MGTTESLTIGFRVPKEGEIELQEGVDEGMNVGHCNIMSIFYNQINEDAALKVVSQVVSAL